MMNPGSHDDSTNPDPATARRGVRTLSEARAWLLRLAENGASKIEIKEPYRQIAHGMIAVTASLVRADGARVFVEVCCYDDRAPAEVDPLSWLPELRLRDAR